MGHTIRKTRSFSLDPELLEEIEQTKGPASASERVSALLRSALEMERRDALREEAARLFSGPVESRPERHAFQNAGIKTWSRE